MKFKPDTTIVIETLTGEVTTEGQQVKHGLVLHRTLNSSWGYTITDPASSGIAASGDTPDEALENLEKAIKANGGPAFAEKLEEARRLHKQRIAAIHAAVEILRPVVRKKDSTYLLHAIATALFPGIEVAEVRVPSPDLSTTRH